MQLPVHTDLYRVRRTLYHIGDLVLPRPIGMVPTLVCVLTLLLEWQVAHRLHLPFTFDLWSLAIYGAIPFAAYRLANRPVVEGRPLHLWALSQVRYVFQHRRLVRLAPDYEPERERLRFGTWQRRDPYRFDRPLMEDEL
jgi:hypothetical protein